MKIGAIVQARMSSRRCPGKVLLKVAGKPLLQYLLERLEKCRSLNSIVVATSTDAADAAIADFCRERGTCSYRGSLTNVAERFKQVLDMYSLDGFVRVNGDSPLLDPILIDKAIAIFLKSDVDIVTNVFERSYPSGQSVEVLRASAFRRGFVCMHNEEDLEHVTRYFYEHGDRFKIMNFKSDRNWSGIHLSIDTADDLDVFAAIVTRMDRPHWQYGVEEVLHLHGQEASRKNE